MDIIEYFDIPVHDSSSVADEVKKYIDSRQDILANLDTFVRISICHTSKSARTGGAERKDQLKTLLALNTGVDPVYKDKKYQFDFDKQVFKETVLIGGKQHVKLMHFTPGEVVALYTVLVKKQVAQSWSAYYANMKSRHGADFLSNLSSATKR